MQILIHPIVEETIAKLIIQMLKLFIFLKGFSSKIFVVVSF